MGIFIPLHLHHCITTSGFKANWCLSEKSLSTMCPSEKCHGSKFSHSDSHFTQPLNWSTFRQMFELKIHSQKSKPLTGWCRWHEMTWMLNNKVIHLRKCFLKTAAHFISFPFDSISSQFFFTMTDPSTWFSTATESWQWTLRLKLQLQLLRHKLSWNRQSFERLQTIDFVLRPGPSPINWYLKPWFYQNYCKRNWKVVQFINMAS